MRTRARTTTARRLRRGMALAACTALLGLPACGTDDGSGADPEASSAEESSAAESSAEASDGGASSSDDEDATDEDPGPTAERTSIILVTELGIDDGSGEGAPTLTADDLAGLLAEPLGGEAECTDELVLELGRSAQCTGPASLEGDDEDQDWAATAVAVPSEDAALGEGYRVAVLFSAGTALPEGASDLAREGVTLTGVGVGSMFGVEPLSAEELADATLQTLTSENAYVQVAEEADWSEVTCEDGLDFTDFRTVGCTAATADGATWQLHVAPGTYADNDPGVLVGIEGTVGG